jgi:hypothetical protein
MEVERKLDIILQKIENMEKRLYVLEKSCNGMDSHIDFINGVYNTVRAPLDFIVRKVTTIQGGNLKEYSVLPTVMNKPNKIITVNLNGGIGNQLFEVAAAYALSLELNAELVIQKEQFAGCRQGTHPSKYYDNLYQKIRLVDNLPIDSNVYEHSWTYSPIFENVAKSFENNNVICIHGYFQSELNFKKYSEDVKNLFTPTCGIISFLQEKTTFFDRFPELKEKQSDYGFIGVRRGDYVTYPHVHNPCGMTYFNKAMSLMPKKKYYVASDDIEWCKQNFVSDKFVFFDIQDDLEQLLAIALFKDYIISNSSFHWWGSFLSIHNDVRIISPDKWIFSTKEQHWSVYRDIMEIVERPVET